MATIRRHLLSLTPAQRVVVCATLLLTSIGAVILCVWFARHNARKGTS